MGGSSAPLNRGFKDATGQSLVYVYAREMKAQADTAKALTMDEAPPTRLECVLGKSSPQRILLRIGGHSH